MPQELEIFCTGPLEVNCSVITDSSDKSAIVIDPGGNADDILYYIQEAGCVLKGILLTHAHFDHIAGLTGLAHLNKEHTVEILMHKEDKYLMDNADSQAARFGMSISPKFPEITKYFENDETISIGKFSFKVLHTPGHSPGSCCLYYKSKNILFSGDTLFANSIGRTDLWGGNFNQLIDSVKEKIFTLPPETKIIPGHGPETTVGNEIKNNPFFR